MSAPDLPAEVLAMSAGLSMIEQALGQNRATVLSPTALALHDDIIRSEARLEIASKVQAWIEAHLAELSVESMRELWAAIGMSPLERDDDPSGYAETQRRDFERECYRREAERP